MKTVLQHFKPKKGIRKNGFLLVLTILFSSGAFAQWTTIANDGNSDSGGMEGTMLEYRHDQTTDSVFFRFTVTNLSSYSSGPAADLHFFLPNGLDNGGAPYTHWTSSTMVHKSFFIYTDAGGSPPSNYTYNSFANKIEAGNPATILCSNCISIVADVANNHLIYGVKRTDLISDSEMGGTTATITAVVANVGHDVMWDDNVTESGNMTISTPTTGIQTTNEDAQFSIYPNPGLDEIWLKRDGFKKAIQSVTILDISGRAVQSFTNFSTNGDIKLNISELNEGTYFLRITSKGNVFTKVFQKANSQ